MGEAKRRAEKRRHITPGTCSGCTLCCEIPEIAELSKAPFQKCINICEAGCSLHEKPEKPDVCRGFRCRYIHAHERNAPIEKEILPHPIEAGAYTYEVYGKRIVVLCVDPANPFAWKQTGLLPFLASFIDMEFTVLIDDRGYRFPIRTVANLLEVASKDYVEGAKAFGKQPNISGFLP